MNMPSSIFKNYFLFSVEDGMKIVTDGKYSCSLLSYFVSSTVLCVI